MGKFSEGIFGNFYGKVGRVVGSSWRGIDYLRSMPKANKNRQLSAKQLEQQARFALMTGFLNPLRDVLDIGYRNYAVGQTTYNSALSVNIVNGISGVYPDLTVDYSLIQLSRGLLPGGINPLASAVAGAKISYSWTDNTGKGKAKANDTVIVLAFCSEDDQAVYNAGSATRADESLELELPADFAGKDVETYIVWAATENRAVSATAYTGKLTVLD